jgi:hypothetical protein
MSIFFLIRFFLIIKLNIIVSHDQFFDQEAYAKELKQHLKDLTSSSLPSLSTSLSTSTRYGLLLSANDASLPLSTISNAGKHLNQDQYKKELNEIIKQIQNTESPFLPLVSPTPQAILLNTVTKNFFPHFDCTAKTFLA